MPGMFAAQQPLTTEALLRRSPSLSAAPWDTPSIKALLRCDSGVIAAEPWKSWVLQRGGIARVFDYLQQCSLSACQRQLLELLLSYPRESAYFYTTRLIVDRSTYFRRLAALCGTLASQLNTWGGACANVYDALAEPQLNAATATSLPFELTSFVGRQPELATLQELIAQPNVSLLTLIGSGGCGKTRLALRLAGALAGERAQRICVVSLAALTDPAHISTAIAAEIGIQRGSQRSMRNAVFAALAAEPTLLVLDSCEHLVEACASFVEQLLNACPDLRILATSRVVLGVAGEMVYPLQPLARPPASWQDMDSDDPVALLRRFAAVDLFEDRARAAQPAFELTRENCAAVAEICRRLDGLPLALELAAAQLRVLSVAEIAARLDQRFELLVHGLRTAPSRQRTLRALLDWSFYRLDEAEQRLFRRLGVFAGPWSLTAAERVCALRPEERGSVFTLLSQLVDKSLVVAEGQGSQARYSMLETLRYYALDRLRDSGELEQLQHNLDRYLLTPPAEPRLMCLAAGAQGCGSRGSQGFN